MTTRKTKAEKIAEALERRQQADNEVKRLQREQREDERKAEYKRHHRRGKEIESLVDGGGEMSDEDFYNIIAKALNKHFPTKKADTAPTPSITDKSKDEGAVTELE